MIPQISEINFPEYATLHEATASFSDMGERTITTQVRIDGDIVPEFDGWELEFKGERFVLPIRDPQARKDNTTRNSLVDLTFYSWPIYQMKRYFFFETTTSATGTVMADKYKASVNLNLVNFVALLNRVLDYYFHGQIVADLAQGSYGTQTALAQIDYSYIWDVVQNFYEMYGVRWRIVYNADDDVYEIKIGYEADVIDNHEFEYGFEGGLLHFERQIEDDNIKNILLGRGGEKNIPYRYFKRTDPNNPGWAADPDAIKELENVYFDRLRDANFRNYVQGWKTNPNRELYPGESLDTYDSERGARDWAYKKGHEDLTFDPVEYVKDDGSIEKYGERWGALEDNDDIYPTIQGLDILDLGRVDEVVAVSNIITDDVEASMEAAAEIVSIDGILSQTDNISAGSYIRRNIRGRSFEVPTGQVANIQDNGWFAIHQSASSTLLYVDTSLSKIRIYGADTDEEVLSADQGLSAGSYYYILDITVRNSGSLALYDVTFGINGIDLVLSEGGSEFWKPTFDIWIKNIFDTERHAGESDEEYSLRVWRPILGDRLGNEAKVIFSDGPMSISEDYEFTIAKYPEPDNTKVTSDGYRSEWKLTLFKSDAEYDVSGFYIPNNTSGGKPVAGNHFFFVGIDMPYMYVTLNEEKLTAYKEYALNSMVEVNPTWVISLDKVRADQINSDSQRLFDQISAGCEMHVKDKRFTGGEVLTLYANSITYSWQEPTDDNPYILPDIEIVVSDKIVIEKSLSDTIRGDIEDIKSTYVKLSDMSTIVPKLTSASFLKKNGEEDVSLSPTRFASLLTSRDFSQGSLGGRGWGFYRDNSSRFQETEEGPEEPEEQSNAPLRSRALMAAAPMSNDEPEKPAADAVLELDKLIVRKEMHVNNLVINQISAEGGKEILSAASMECVQVVETDTSYICFFDQKQGTVQNLFAVGDIAMGQVFTPDNLELRYYKMVITATDVDSITIAKQGKVGSGVPKKGDVIVQYGSTNNPARQYIIVRDVIGGGYERMISGLNSLNAEGAEYYFAGYDPAATEENKARFYIGSQNSHMEFKENEGLFIKGALNVSPSGDTFPSIVPRGEYSAATTYNWGDLVTYNGSSYLFISETAASGKNPETETTYWQRYVEKGSVGSGIETQWSVDGTSWHDNYQTGDLYMRERPTGGTWSAAIRVVGEDGGDGPWISFVFRASDTQPATPTSHNPVPTEQGWSDQPPVGEYDVINPSFEGGWVVSGKTLTSNTISHSQSTWEKIIFTTTKANTAVGIKITASSEANYDKGYVGNLDAASSTSSYKAVVSGTQSSTVTFNVATVGTHYIYVGYVKDSSQSGGSDKITVEILGGAIVWMSKATVTDGVAGTWSAPVKITGEDGQPGAPGTPGADGTISKFQWAKKSDSSTPSTSDWVNTYPSSIAGYYIWQRQAVYVNDVWHALDGSYEYPADSGEYPNTVGVIHDPTAYEEENTSREEIAKKLGYTNWAAFEQTVAAKQVIIKGGMINADLIDVSLLVADIMTTGLAGERVEISDKMITIKDVGNIDRISMDGKTSYSSISNFAQTGSGTTHSTAYKSGSIAITVPSGIYQGSFDTGLIYLDSTSFTVSSLSRLANLPYGSVSHDGSSYIQMFASRATIELYLVDTDDNMNMLVGAYYINDITTSKARSPFSPFLASVGASSYRFAIRVHGYIVCKSSGSQRDRTLTYEIGGSSSSSSTAAWSASFTSIDEKVQLFSNGLGYKYDSNNYMVGLRGSDNHVEWGVQRGLSSAKYGITVDRYGIQGVFGGDTYMQLVPILYAAYVTAGTSGGNRTPSDAWNRTGQSITINQVGTNTSTSAYFTVTFASLPSSAAIFVMSDNTELFHPHVSRSGNVVTVKFHGINNPSNIYARNFSIIVLA